MTSRRFWMVFALLLSVALGGLLWHTGKQADEARAYEHYISGLYRSNEHLFVHQYVSETERLAAEEENEELKKELMWKGGRRDRRPF